MHVSAPTTEQPVALDPLDFLAIDALLDDEEKAIRDTVRQFVREQIVPEVGDWFEQGILPREVIQELAKLGLFGMHLDGYGLPGASAVAYGLTCLELEAGDSGIRSVVSVQGSLAMFAIWRWGSEEQKEQWLPRMHTGEVIGCFGLTEPDAGSDPGTMRTHARRDGSDWILNGAKMWITNGTIADIAIVWARTEDGEIRGFIVEKGTPGLLRSGDPQEDVAPRLGHVGARARRRPRAGRQHAAGREVAARARSRASTRPASGSCSGAVGAARACFEAALEYSKTRIVFDKPISAYQLTSRSSPRWRSRSTAPRSLALHVGRMKDAGTLRAGARQPRQDGQRPRRDRGLPQRPHDPRRQRDHARVPGDPAHEQPRVRPHLRGHARGAHARRRRRADRHAGVPVERMSVATVARTPTAQDQQRRRRCVLRSSTASSGRGSASTRRRGPSAPG